MKKITNKKAIFELPGAVAGFIIWAFFFLAVIIIILFAGLRSCTIGEQAELNFQSKSAELSSNIILINIMKTPVLVNETNLTIAELGALSLYDASFNQQIDNQLNNIFEKMPGSYALEISKANRNRIFGSSSLINIIRIAELFAKPPQIASVQMPAQDFGVIEFKLYKD